MILKILIKDFFDEYEIVKAFFLEKAKK